MLTLNKPGNPVIPADARNEAVIAHLAGAALLFAGPLVIWTLRRTHSAFGAEALKQALNWQIYATVAALIPVALGMHFAGYCLLCNAAYSLYAALCSSRGIEFRHVLPYRFLA